MDDIVKILIFSFGAYVYLLLISKLEGKKQIAQLDFSDYVIAITIGSIAAEFTTDTVNPWYNYVIAIGVVFIANMLVNWISRKSYFLKKVFNGTPLVLIEEGRINYQNLKKSKLDVNSLLMLLRVQGYFDITDVAYAYFETNGDISVLPVGAKRPVVIQDIDNSKIERASITENLIVDGHILKSTLTSLNQNEAWVKEKLHIKSKKDLKNIILATYDEKTDKITAQYKNQQNNS